MAARPGGDSFGVDHHHHHHEREEHEEGHQARHGCQYVVTQVAELIFIEEGDQFIPLQNIPVTTFIDSYKVTMLGNNTGKSHKLV